MKGYKFLFVGLILLFATQIHSQHFLRASGKSIVNENQETVLLRGMGLGGWMVQEGYMLQTSSFANPQHEIRAKIEELIGESNTDLFYEAWLDNHVRKADIDSLKSWGFNSVRLPMHYNLYTLPIEEEPIPGEQTWLEKGFELTDSLISWCKQNEMYVILDLHAAPGGQGYDAGISDYDDTKPSLWESKANRDKMVALWGNLATRYADEQWVAGYDLLNEPNWEIPGGLALKALYVEVTNAIRAVDTKHIIFIEGNWFANDFTGLTPPWDDNMVYSPHKYWSTNDKASIQWVLNIRDTYNVPLYLGESGENSNVWFRNAIRLLEDHDIGWAWWPMKKIESIAGPLSITKSAEYQSLLDYWGGTGSAPSVTFAKNTLMTLTEDLKIENCRFQKDVIDAMFRQVYSDETQKFANHKIPGVIHASDYDLGVVGEAYYDQVVATFHVSSGNYTAWNNGWTYRNDGVDLEVCSDNVNSNGYNVGFTEAGEWMQYEVEVQESGVYDIQVRVASGATGGKLHFSSNDASITSSVTVPSTGGWQNWQTVSIPDVILDTNDNKIRFHIDQAEYNISNFTFIKSEKSISSIETKFVAAETVDNSTIQMNTNKFLQEDLPAVPAGFSVIVNGNSVEIMDIQVDAENQRIVYFSIDYYLKSSDLIQISFDGNGVFALDDSSLSDFTLEPVSNNLEYVFEIPTKIEAEDYFFQTGTELETTTDAGGGQNIGYLDPGDYLDYDVNVEEAGEYVVIYRTASLNGNGALELQFIDEFGMVKASHGLSFIPTGGWQTWVSSSKSIQLPQGRFTMRILITKASFNLNWVEFTKSTSVLKVENPELNIKIFPNPATDEIKITGDLNKIQNVDVEIFDQAARSVFFRKLENIGELNESILLDSIPSGIYRIRFNLEDGTTYSDSFIIKR